MSFSVKVVMLLHSQCSPDMFFLNGKVSIVRLKASTCSIWTADICYHCCSCMKEIMSFFPQIHVFIPFYHNQENFSPPLHLNKLLCDWSEVHGCVCLCWTCCILLQRLASRIRLFYDSKESQKAQNSWNERSRRAQIKPITYKYNGQPTTCI